MIKNLFPNLVFYSLMLIFSSLCSFGQEISTPKDSTKDIKAQNLINLETQKYLPTVTPPSPMAMQMQKYGDYPVGHTTGIPQIEVPIYTIKSGNLSLPIYLSYHASGFKPNEKSGIVGLGWTLNAGGRISRTVIGDPDEQAGTPAVLMRQNVLGGAVQNSTAGNYLYFLYLDETQSGNDMQPDIFYYSYPTGNGKFLLKKEFNNADEYQNYNKPITMPYKPIKINSNSVNFNSDFTYFEIVDEQGTTHRYGKSIDNIDVVENTIPRGTSKDYKTSWLLTDITSQGNKNHIKIEYYKDIYSITSNRTDFGIVKSSDETGFPFGNNLLNDFVQPHPTNEFQRVSVATNTSASTNYMALIKSIVFDNGKVDFTYNTTGTTFEDYSLKSIIISDVSNNIIEKYSFTFQNYNQDTQRYKLKKIERESKVPTNTNKEVHNFEYYEPASQVPNGAFNLTGLDFWGFYNGQNANGNLLPSNFKIQAYSNNTGSIGTYSTSDSDREPNEEYTKYCILKKIIFPTGGSTEFQFEGNKVNWASQPRMAGGLRVKSIIKSTGSQSEQKTYSYGGDGCQGCGHLRLNPFMLESFFSLGYEYEYVGLSGGCSTNNKFTITISSDIVDGSSYFEISPVLYSTATEIIGLNNANIGKIDYEYSLPSLTFSNNGNFRYLSTIDYWKGSNLKKIETFKNQSNAYLLVKKEDFLFENTSRPGDSIFAQYVKPYTLGLDGQPVFPFPVCGHNKEAFNINDYSISTGAAQLKKKTTDNY